MSWSQYQKEQHKKAAKKLDAIMQSVFLHIQKRHKSITEYEISQYILNLFDKSELKTDNSPPIVAFSTNTSFVHYFPQESKCKKLENNSLVMIDIWAREKERLSPYADITWMGFWGRKIPSNIQKEFDLVKRARDQAIDFIIQNIKKDSAPAGLKIDNIVRQAFQKEQKLGNFLHTTGHSLGMRSPHGKYPSISQKNANGLIENMGYTIEPGLYFENDFGIRSEINFIFNEKNIEITTQTQEKILMM